MSRLARKLLVAAMLALYGSVSLCGGGLHALEDIGRPGSSDRALDPSDSDSDVLTGGSSSDHCPICHHLVQGQMPVEGRSPAPQPLVQFRIPAIGQVATGLDRYSSSHPRAPPSAPASIF